MSTVKSGVVAVPESVRFLQQPDAYPEPTITVTYVETHFSHVFLTDHYVYKLKKSERYPFLDLSTLDARRANCQEEVCLNRELAPDVYLGMAKLHRAEDGSLNLKGHGAVVDYLVCMVRLNEQDNLEYQLSHGSPRHDRLEAAAAQLAAFYQRRTDRQTLEPGVRRDCILRHASELSQLMDDPHVQRLHDGLIDWVGTHAALLSDRRSVDAHGDLRPQHIYLCDPPRIIDRLEFDARLRRMDPLEELAFLALECERLGQSWAGDCFMAQCSKQMADRAPDGLVAFYKASRALTWALLSARHLVTGQERRVHWLTRSRQYLELGIKHLESAV